MKSCLMCSIIVKLRSRSWSIQYQSNTVLFRLNNLDQEVMLFLLCHTPTDPVNFSKPSIVFKPLLLHF